MSGAIDASRAEVLRFWRSVELFDPQRVPAANANEHVYDVDVAAGAPWDPGHPLGGVRLKPRQRWLHTVYCGVFRRDAALDLLLGLFPADHESFDDRRVGGDSALIALVVSDEGRPLLGSQVLSSCAWAIGRSIDPGPGSDGWLDGLEEARDAVGVMFEKLADTPAADQPPEPGGGPVGRPISIDDLQEVIDGVIELLGVQQLGASAVRVHSRAVNAKAADRADQHDFLNSFIAADLALVADEIADGNIGSALTSYLSFDDEIDRSARIDVHTRLDVVHAAVGPARVPLGRWPAPAEHPLGLSQQLAVATAIQTLGDGAGMFAVNGPPGTGKTTMLREIVADVVVRRAQQLALLPTAHAAFAGKHRWKTGDYVRTVHAFNEQLTGFEMVVACATNGAAENISIEIPGIDAIDPDRQGEIDYYPDLATRLLNTKRQPAAGPEAVAWGMVAGCLGNMANRASFARTLWFTEKAPSARGAGQDASVTAATVPAGSRPGLLEILQGYEAAPPGPPWSESVAAFRSVFDRARDLGRARARVFDLLNTAHAVEADADLRRLQAAAAPGEVADARRAHGEQQQAAAAHRDDRDRCLQARRDHREFHPRLRDSLTSAGRAATRDWHTTDRELSDAAATSQTAVTAAETRTRQLADDAAAAETRMNALQTAAAAAQARVRDLHTELADARDRYGTFMPDREWWQDRDRREREAPWIDTEWNAARTDLFLAALRLHKAFVIATAKQMKQSLHGAIDILTGDAPNDLQPQAALAAWRSLFFMVPVLSTSFASFARVFSHLGRESLGWLFIDEAGQCTPQNPAGAIWRSRRVVVVGDPLQLEPVITLPFTAQQALRREHAVDETWLPSRHSAQKLADRVSQLGTLRGHGGDALWVGAPLNVHRRCDEPIFQVVNAIAYDGQMVNATPDRPYLRLPPSKWLHVASTHADGHWIPAEGQQLSIILEHLSTRGQDFSQVFVLSPFRQVARHLYALGDRYPPITTGTIHTAQGREADIVILVLGGDPARPGAKQWAAERPNLLNVAASRAKRRLYVIGNRDAWSQQPYFNVLADHLPTS